MGLDCDFRHEIGRNHALASVKAFLLHHGLFCVGRLESRYRKIRRVCV